MANEDEAAEKAAQEQAAKEAAKKNLQRRQEADRNRNQGKKGWW